MADTDRVRVSVADTERDGVTVADCDRVGVSVADSDRVGLSEDVSGDDEETEGDTEGERVGDGPTGVGGMYVVPETHVSFDVAPAHNPEGRK